MFAVEKCHAQIVPNDYVSWWKFELNADDEAGVNDGALIDSMFVSSSMEIGRYLKLYDRDNPVSKEI